MLLQKMIFSRISGLRVDVRSHASESLKIFHIFLYDIARVRVTLQSPYQCVTWDFPAYKGVFLSVAENRLSHRNVNRLELGAPAMTGEFLALLPGVSQTCKLLQ